MTHATLRDRCYRTILEAGCGTGKNTQLLVRLSDAVHALDFSEGMLRQARARNLGPGVTFTQVDLTRPWPVADAWAELVTCNLVLEHIADLRFIFAEAARVLAPGGQFFVSELHPFKQYLGSKAVFGQGDERTQIPAFVHHISEFLDAAAQAGLTLESLREWWHDEDQGMPPRLVTFLFVK